MVADILRDSTFGQVVHWASSGRLFSYDEERPGFVPPEHLLARHDDLSSPSHGSSSSSPGRGRQSTDAATLVEGKEGKSKRAYHSEQEKHDAKLDAQEGSKTDGEKKEERDASRGRDEEEDIGEEERERRDKERVENHPGTANPRRAHAEGLHEKYQYLVKFEEGDPANPLCVFLFSSSSPKVLTSP
jgi:hypothetical protein